MGGGLEPKSDATSKLRLWNTSDSTCVCEMGPTDSITDSTPDEINQDSYTTSQHSPKIRDLTTDTGCVPRLSGTCKCIIESMDSKNNNVMTTTTTSNNNNNNTNSTNTTMTTRLPLIESSTNRREEFSRSSPKRHGPWGDAKEARDQLHDSVRFPRICKNWSPPVRCTQLLRIPDGESGIKLPSSMHVDAMKPTRSLFTGPTPNPVLLPLNFTESATPTSLNAIVTYGDKRLRSKTKRMRGNKSKSRSSFPPSSSSSISSSISSSSTAPDRTHHETKSDTNGGR